MKSIRFDIRLCCINMKSIENDINYVLITKSTVAKVEVCILCSALISACARGGQGAQALQILGQMAEASLRPNRCSIAFVWYFYQKVRNLIYLSIDFN